MAATATDVESKQAEAEQQSGKTAPPETGRITSRDKRQGWVDLWKRAEELNAASKEAEGTNYRKNGVWIPIQAIEIDESILPRNGTIDPDAVERYIIKLRNGEEPDPIDVQKGSFKAMNGNHRIRSAAQFGRDHIRAIERDVSDDQLFVEAFRANDDNGVPLTMAHRRTYAQKLLAAWPEMTDQDIAKEAGVSHSSVARWRAGTQEEPPTEPGTEDQGEPETGNNTGGNTGPKDLFKLPLMRQLDSVQAQVATAVAASCPAFDLEGRAEFVDRGVSWLNDYKAALDARIAKEITPVKEAEAAAAAASKSSEGANGQGEGVNEPEPAATGV